MTTEIQPTRATFGDQERPDPEVLTRPKRRRFTAEYRHRPPSGRLHAQG